MLHVAPGVKVYLACQPVDMRRGAPQAGDPGRDAGERIRAG